MLKKMLKYTPAFAITGIVALGIFVLGVSGKPSSVTGSWRVDPHYSDAQMITDGTTNYGKDRIDVTVGFGRINGDIRLDDSDPAKSSFDLHIYPATSMGPSIEEDGNFKAHWLENLANQTLVCFHSKKMVRTANGQLQVTGDLVATRVDRNVDATPSEGYSGPVYGPPIVHRTVQEGTFIFNLPSSAAPGQKGGIVASGSTKVFAEDFPQLVKAVVTTFWPPMVQDEKCTTPAASEAYSGLKCTGRTLEGPGLPVAPGTAPGEDYPAPSNYSAVVGQRLTILVHMHLLPKAPAGETAGAN
jgi:polyisoprenoid-binding protein YceI